MRFSATDIYSLFSPKKCERRVFLRSHHEPEAQPGEFDKLIVELGQRHERNHLLSFKHYVDLREGKLEDRAARTLEAIKAGAEVIYQGVFFAKLPNSSDEVIGVPDFILKEDNGYAIRDCKLARHADEKRHREIVMQLQLYGWLYENCLHARPHALEVYLGDQSIAQISYDGGTAAVGQIKEIRNLCSMAEEPYSPVGWSKCGGCGFRERCWGIAKDSSDVAIVYDLDQGAAKALRDEGVSSIDQLLDRFDVSSLSELKRPRGAKRVKVGTAAERILLQAEALKSGKERRISPLELPSARNLVMFDLEGLPPQFDELDKVYLWGTQVFGEKPDGYLAALAGFGEDGDCEGWYAFLGNAERIFATYTDIPFVHWHHYETTKIKAYIDHYGDRDGIPARVLNNCVDLLKITRQSLVLPVSSYSLKVIEGLAGFERTMEDFGGDWSIAQYIKAVETGDDNLRKKIMNNILKYNEEDLKATWAVFRWLLQKV